MRPLQIEVANFGAIPHALINLVGIDLASVCGANGAGKSTAITIAPMFALFGTTKSGCSADNMVRTGATEASVAFDFDHHGEVWRVIRTRSTKGKGKSTLELQRQSGELWASESGASIAETQKKIIQLLNLDEETFLSSSMILQGRSNEFTSRPAGQRKAILAQILQLEQYESLQDKSRAKAGEVSQALEKIKTQIAVIDQRLAEKPSLESKKLTAEMQKAHCKSKIKRLEAELHSHQIEYSVLLAKLQQAEQIGQQAEGLRNEVKAKSFERDRSLARLETAKQLLNKEEVILNKATEHEQIKNTVTELRVKRSQQDAIFQEASRLKEEFVTVEKSQSITATKVKEIEAVIEDRPRLLAVKAEYDRAIIRMDECQKLREEDQCLLAAVKECNDQLIRVKDQYINQEVNFKQQINTLEVKAAMLADANCVDIKRAQCRFLANAIEAERELVNVRDQYSVWKAHMDIGIASAQKELTAAQDAYAAFGFNPLEPIEVQQKINQLKPDVDKLAQISAMEPLLETLTTQLTELNTRHVDINTRLEAMRAQYKELSEGLKQLPELESKLSTLEPWLKSKEQLPAAREIATIAKEAVDKLNEEIEVATIQADKLQLEYTELFGDAEGLKCQAEEKVKNVQEALKTHQDEHLYLATQLGGIQAKLDSLAQDEQQRLTLAADMEPLAKELVRWQTLVKAFGRDGIPALIIENAVPELERISNDILGQMSGGKHYLRFETQRELKSRSGMTETLDIIVGDWAGERIYETFSGGEQLRIDFAIRFALAELLARRAGARVDWVCVDEGFGSQSEEYLPLVIDAIKSISSRFGMVLVISHVKAVQEAFEQKIVFMPTDEGVEVLVA